MDTKIKALLIGVNDYIKRIGEFAVQYGISVEFVTHPNDIGGVIDENLFDIIFFDVILLKDKDLENFREDILPKTSVKIIVLPEKYDSEILSESYILISDKINYLDFTSLIKSLIQTEKFKNEINDIQNDYCIDYSTEITDDLYRYKLEALNAISVTISGSLDLQIILDLSLAKILEISGMDTGIIYFVNDSDNFLTMAAQHGLTRKATEMVNSFQIKPGTVADKVMHTYQPLIRDYFDKSEFPITNERFNVIVGMDIKTLVAIPLKSRDHITGILYLLNEKVKIVTSNDLEILSLAGNQIGLAIDNAKLYNNSRFELAERQKAENKLNDTVTLYTRILDNINDIIFSTDTNGRITYVNSVVEKIFGYYPAEMIGKPFTVYVHQEDLPDLIKKFQQVLLGVYEPSNYRIRHKDGTYLWVRSSSKLFFKDNKPFGINGVMTDITKLHFSKAVIDDKFAMIDKLTANIPGFIFKLRYTKGVGWLFDYVSDGVVDIGYQSSDVIDNFMLFIGALRMEDQGKLWAELDESLRNHTTVETMLRYRNKDGNEVNMQFYIKPDIWNESDSVWYGCCIRFNGISQ